MTGRWLVTGAGGMLGRDLVLALRSVPDLTLTALGRSELDITETHAVRAAVSDHDVVLNTAAWTDVDGAEADEAAATAVNGSAVANLAGACAEARALLIHVSTDYVFSGDARMPYREDAPTDPINAYGRSKLVGELAVRERLPHTGYVVRTAWLYGEHGSNFVTTMLRLAGEREHVDVVDDQVGQPTWSLALSRRLIELGRAAQAGVAPAGVYHATASGQTTWYGFARAIYGARGLDPDRIRPTTSDRFPRPARRPRYSVLGHDRWRDVGLAPMPAWDDALTEALRRPALSGADLAS
jgi:dTDP-4-dehydrorhamnose reductase